MNARIVCSAVFALAAMAARAVADDTPDPEQWLKEAEAAYERVTSYSAVFHKQQRVDGKLQPKETILLKFRKPASLYMKWIKAPYKGSELLYVPGWNENKVKAHRGGLLRFITRNLDPGDPALMADNLRPVTSTGIGYLLETVATNMRKAIKVGELEFSIRGEETVYGRPTRIVEIVFPIERMKDHDGFRFVLNQDLENRVLVRIRTYDRDGQLVEDYAYENLDLGASLSDVDFDSRNPDYRF